MGGGPNPTGAGRNQFKAKVTKVEDLGTLGKRATLVSVDPPARTVVYEGDDANYFRADVVFLVSFDAIDPSVPMGGDSADQK